jgi:hypothetical protein
MTIASAGPKLTGEVVAALNLDAAQWERVRVAAVERAAVGPAGQVGTVTDKVIVLRRASRSCRVVEDQSERVPLS